MGMSKAIRETNEHQMLFLVEQYKRVHGIDHADPDDVAGWLMETRRYVPEPVDPRQALRRKIARAFKGRKVYRPTRA